jgi:hypothetical protein
MQPTDHDTVPDLESDPFGELSPMTVRAPLHLLGARVQFESNHRGLLRLVDLAYAGLPRHRVSTRPPRLRIRLQLSGRRSASRATEPPPLALFHGPGLLGGATDSSNFVVVSAQDRGALVVVSPQMLRFPYHTRYELIEFAVFALAARVQHLVGLHAACVGLGGRGILLLGPSGAGKSTVALHCLLGGFDFLSEDSVFIAPRTMLATGVANFLHVRADSLRWLGRSAVAAEIRRSPVIQRRSGAKKFEVDLRREPYRLARSALKIVAVVFLSAQSAEAKPLAVPMSKSTLLAKMASTQAYAARQPQWQAFTKQLRRLPAFELRRGQHPSEAVDALVDLIGKRR